MAYEKIVAVYDKSVKAKDAMRALESAGFAPRDMSMLNRDSLTSNDVNDAGLWRRLIGRNISDNQSALYNRAIDAGGAVLSVHVPETEVPRAMQILDVHRSQNLNVSETIRDTTGSGRSRTSASTSTSSITSRMETATPSTLGLDRDPVREPARDPGRVVTGKEEVLNLAAEQLDVGKRQIETGKARVRRFVVEEPVESQVTLHEEHATLQRRRPGDGKAIDVKDVDWSDKVIEVTETAERPVISKTVHIAEEVVVRREGSDHTEVVRDKVRRQQVEIERQPGDTRKAA
jgi:uncharacterized protein (TIGR02271 family)